MMKQWQPRPPSPGLRSRIFASEPKAAAFEKRPLDFATLTRWLIPAMGCFIMVTGSLRDRPMATPQSTGPLSGQLLAFSMGSALEHNNIPATTLEWTFGRPSSSSSDSFIRTETNTLSK
jgi:hypothetical protein